MINRVEKEQGKFTMISNQTYLRDKSLSLKAMGLLTFMLSCNDDFDFNVSGLCTLFKDNEKSIRTAIKELETAGYLKIERRRKGNKWTKSIWNIYEYKFTHCENVHVEKQNVEIQNVENIPQSNINKRNINKRNIEVCEESTNCSLTEEETHTLYNTYDKRLVDEKIERSKLYKNCFNFPTIQKWCEEDKNKYTSDSKPENKNTKSTVKNRFNNFDQREYSLEELNELEQKLLNRHKTNEHLPILQINDEKTNLDQLNTADLSVLQRMFSNTVIDKAVQIARAENKELNLNTISRIAIKLN